MKLDPESEQIREVYARYGLAMYQAQCLERQVAMLLSLLHADPTRTTRAEFNHLLDGLFEQTLGALVHQMVTPGRVASDLQTRLKAALDKRNWLAHNYFWERAGQFARSDRRDAMIEELQDLAAMFDALDSELVAICFELSRKAGVTDEIVAKHLEQIIANAETEA
jgi:hypothetical protein